MAKLNGRGLGFVSILIFFDEGVFESLQIKSIVCRKNIKIKI